MNYLEEAKHGEEICLDELRVSDMIEILRDYDQNKNEDVCRVLIRVYYAGYSVGYKDATGLMDAKQKADRGGGCINVDE